MNLKADACNVERGCCVVAGTKQRQDSISAVPEQPKGQYSRKLQRVALLGAWGALALAVAEKSGLAAQLGYPEYAWVLLVVAILFSAMLPLNQVFHWLTTGNVQAGAITFLLAAGAMALGRFDAAVLLLSMWTLTAVMRARIYELVALPLATWQVLGEGEWPNKENVAELLAKQTRQPTRTRARATKTHFEEIAATDDLAGGAVEAAAALEDLDPIGVDAEPVIEQESIVVSAGSVVPRDGLVLSNGALVSTLWDNLLATSKEVGEWVYAGDINLGPELIMQPARAVEDTALVAAAQLGRRGMVPLIQRSASGRTLRVWSLWCSIAAVLVTAVAPFAFGVTLSEALYKGMAFLALALPGAWGAAVELPVVAATGAAFRRRYVPAAGWVVSQMAQLGSIVLVWDATIGRVRRFVADVLPIKPKACSPRELLALAAAVEMAAGGTDAIAVAICSAAEKEGLTLPSAIDGRRKHNQGAAAMIEGHMCYVGNESYMGSQGIDISGAEAIMQTLAKQECRPVFCAAGGYLLGVVGISEPQRQAWPHIADQLRKLAVKIVVVNGNAIDGRSAWAPGHPEGAVSLLTGQEIPTIRSWENSQVSIGVAGDATNDRDLLNQADVGIAIGPVWSGDQAGHLLHMHSGLTDLPWLIKLGKSLRRRTIWLNMLCALVRIISLVLVVVFGVGAVEIVALDMLLYAMVAAVALHLLGKDPIPLPHQLQVTQGYKKRRSRQSAKLN